jgi:hypothetical protein
MRRRAERLGEIAGLAAQFLRDVAERPIVASAHTAARIRLKMRRVMYLDRAFAPDAQAIARNASLLYGADREALRRHPGGQQALKRDLAQRLKALQESARTKISSGARPSC